MLGGYALVSKLSQSQCCTDRISNLATVEIIIFVFIFDMVPQFPFLSVRQIEISDEYGPNFMLILLGESL